jgi:hypothetical protein
MQSQFVTLIILMVSIFLNGCSTIQMDKSYDGSRALLSKTRDTCLNYVNNELLAQKKCFPILADKKLLIEASAIKSTFRDFRLEGMAGSEKNRVWCELDKSILEALKKDPTLIEIGKKYWVEGEFAEFTTFGPYDYLCFFTLKNCKVTKWDG